MNTQNIENIMELSPLQQGMLFHTLYSTNLDPYVYQYTARLKGALSVSAFTRAWQQVMDRHQVLRTCFYWQESDKPLQVVHKRIEVPFVQEDWRDLAANERQERLEAYLQADRERRFDFSKPPLLRLSVIQLERETYQFVWSFHHILLDGWSIHLLLNEVFAYYEAYRRGDELELPWPRPYGDYIASLRRDLSKAEHFWRRELKGFTSPISLPVDTGFNDAGVPATEYLSLSAELTAALRSLARQHQVTLNTLMQGVWGLLLSHYTGRTDIVFGSVVSGRPHDLDGVESMVGLFINTLPTRIKIEPHATLVSWLKQLQAEQFEARQYEYSPLVQVQRWSEVPRTQPLFEYLMAFENFPMNASATSLAGHLQLETVQSFEQNSYPLALVIMPYDEMLLTFSYSPARFAKPVVAQMLNDFQTLLQSIVDDPGQRLAELMRLNEPELLRLLSEWNDTRADFPSETCIHHLFEQQVARHPEKAALIYEGKPVSYGELNRRANQLAHHLLSLGLSLESRVGICLERSVDMIVALLAVMKAGGAYVPLDPQYPQARLEYMLKDSHVEVLFTQERLIATLPEHDARVVCIDAEWETIGRQSTENPSSGVTADNLVYIIYTSGSTGNPKGVLVQHRGLCNLTEAQVKAFDTHPDARMLQFASLSFDASIFEIVMAWRCGATLYLTSEETALPGAALAQLLHDGAVTLVTLPPSVLTVMPEEQLPSLQTIIVAGEACPAELVQRWGVGRRFFNAYGPTETTVWATVSECQPDGRQPTIGRPIINAQTYLLNTNLQPVPVGVPGELHIAGVGLARGYLNCPDLTAARFIPNPFSSEPGSRLYKTGDLARFLANGEIDYLGRIDHQVKVRGYRIELREIEAVLHKHAAVRQSVVVTKEKTTGQKQLIAYVVAQPGEQVRLVELKDFLKESLPEYMIPAAFVVLDALPLNANGKVDRKALPDPERVDLISEGTYVAPRNVLELQLAQIWQSILGVEQVGVHDNFFDLGGDSLLAVRLIAQIRKRLGHELPLATLIEAATIECIATSLSEHDGKQRLSALAPIQPKGTHTPFFCIHPGSGNVLCYLPLAKHLGTEWPFYGLQDPNTLEDPEKQSASVFELPLETMAAHYVEAITSVQPQGPYLLGGWSFGGFVAYEMAQQLRTRGEEVSLLAILDTGPVFEEMGESDDAHLLAILCEESGLPIKAEELRRLTPNDQLNHVAEQLKTAKLIPSDISISRISHSLNIFKARIKVVTNYRFKSYDGPITLFRASELDADNLANAAYLRDPTMGWRDFTRHGVDVHTVPGTHATMGREPNVKVLAATLKKCLEQVAGELLEVSSATSN